MQDIFAMLGPLLMEVQKYQTQQMELSDISVQLEITVSKVHLLQLFAQAENIGMVLEHHNKLSAKIVLLNTHAHLLS